MIRFAAALLVALLLPVGPAPVAARQVEEILSYDVAIELLPGGTMEVNETLRVRALGEQIRRGIFRDFPTSFPRSVGMGRIEAPFDVLSVTRDGAPEPYSVEAVGGPMLRGGMRVRIGDANVLLQPGVHTYELRYVTDRWVRFGDDEDQLYWNVTGNDWAFPIRSASASVRIPGLDATPRLESWTGPEGATTSDATASWDTETQAATFRTDQYLLPGDGLTVRVTFPSGYLPPPTEEQRSAWFRMDWGGYVDAGWVVLLVIAVYLLMWRQVGMDPAPGRTGLLREPPSGYSPAALGFIQERGYEMSQLSAALVNMALKGAVRIEQDGGTWTLHRLQTEPEGLSPEEKAAFDGLLGSRAELKLSQSRHEVLRSGINAFRRSLASRLEREYFHTNRAWFVAGLVVTIAGFAALAWRWRFAINPVALFLGFWLSIWTIGVATLALRLAQQVRAAMGGGGPVAWAGAGFLALFATPFFLGEVVVGGILSTMVPGHLLLAAVVLGGTNVLFYHLLERPTLKGRGVLDQVEGFRSYLEGADDRALHRDADRLALFERFLPFAIALGLEKRWSEAFEDVLVPALARPGGTSRPLGWYDHDHGRSRNFSAGSFASSLGSGLSGRLSSASSPPQSSSGSGGGGFSGGGSSGGGGGGGGGGGW